MRSSDLCVLNEVRQAETTAQAQQQTSRQTSATVSKWTTSQLCLFTSGDIIGRHIYKQLIPTGQQILWHVSGETKGGRLKHEGRDAAMRHLSTLPDEGTPASRHR